jgi:hypothetical protein
LPAIQRLTVRQVNIGDRELTKVDDLANPIEQRPGLDRNDLRRL